MDGCWLGFNTRTGEHKQCSGGDVPQHSETKQGRTLELSKFGATLGCRGCLVIGQPHTEECRARITARMENDPVHAKRLEDNLNRRNEFANPETTVAAPSEGRTDATKRARQVETPQESADTGGASGSSAEVDVDM